MHNRIKNYFNVPIDVELDFVKIKDNNHSTTSRDPPNTGCNNSITNLDPPNLGRTIVPDHTGASRNYSIAVLNHSIAG